MYYIHVVTQKYDHSDDDGDVHVRPRSRSASKPLPLFWCTLTSRPEVMRRNIDNFLATLITAVAHKR